MLLIWLIPPSLSPSTHTSTHSRTPRVLSRWKRLNLFIRVSDSILIKGDRSREAEAGKRSRRWRRRERESASPAGSAFNRGRSQTAQLGIKVGRSAGKAWRINSIYFLDFCASDFPSRFLLSTDGGGFTLAASYWFELGLWSTAIGCFITCRNCRCHEFIMYSLPFFPFPSNHVIFFGGGEDVLRFYGNFLNRRFLF